MAKTLRLLVFWCISVALILSSTCVEGATKAQSIPQLGEWKEFPGPTPGEQAEVWLHSAVVSGYCWEVYLEENVAKARRCTGRWSRGLEVDSPPGRIHNELFAGGGVVQSYVVEDGRIVGNVAGELKSSIWWISTDRRRRVRLSMDRLRQFVKYKGGLLYIEGRFSTVGDYGSLNFLRKTSDGWRSELVTTFDECPMATSVQPDSDRLLIAFANSFATFDDELGTHIVREVPWRRLYPNSVAMPKGGNVVFVGMMQYVAEVDVVKGSVRFLLPESSYLTGITRVAIRQTKLDRMEKPAHTAKNTAQEFGKR